MKVAAPFNPDAPLERIKRETVRAHKAFIDYALTGSRRSLRLLLERYRREDSQWTKNPTKYTQPPTTRWTTIANWSKRYQWVERAKAFDLVQRERELIDYEQERDAWRKKRRRLIDASFVKTNNALIGTEMEGVTFHTLINALRTLNKEVRMEFEIPENELDILAEATQKGYSVVSPDDWDDED